MSLAGIERNVRSRPSWSPSTEVETPRSVRTVARVLLGLLLVTPLVLAFLPWRQSISGAGRVVGYAPLDRQFYVEAPISGRVREWYVAEGTHVKKGTLIARITDNDLQYLDALQAQLAAVREKRATCESEVTLCQDVTRRFDAIREIAVQAAQSNVEVARQKVASEEQELVAVSASLESDKLQYERYVRLLPQGLVSRREYELAEQKYRETSAKRQKAEAMLEGARGDLRAKLAYREEVKTKAQAELEKSRAEVQKAGGKVAECTKEIHDLEVKIRRQQVQEVVAPREGTILRLLVGQESEQVKEGDPIAVLVPETADLGVELWVDGNDAPLVRPGDHVRLQFEGWPSVQVAGWPSVSVGSFGGEVTLVDAADNGKGKFRLLVRPDANANWPSPKALRQGVRARGWVLLGEVRLGYELWRRLNGFPQSIDEGIAEHAPLGGSGKEKTASGGMESAKEKVKIKRPK